MDPSLAAQLVARDVEKGLAEVFEPSDGGGFSLTDPVFEDRPITNELVTAVPWVWRGVHTGRSPLLPYQRTGRPVAVEGLTLVTDGPDGEPQFTRYVDWVGALAQIGITLTDRPVLDEVEVGEQLADLAED